MHHTINLFYKCNSQEFSALFEVLHSLCTNGYKFYKENNSNNYQCELFKNNGLQIRLVQYDFPDGICYKSIEIILNPMRLLNGHDYISLASISSVDQIYKAFKTLWSPVRKVFNKKRSNKILKFRLDMLDAYAIKRIDFALNIHSIHAGLYMKLIQRSKIPKGFELYKEYDYVSRRSKPPKNSFYIFKRLSPKNKNSYGSITINVYNKGIQMQEKSLPGYENALSVIRFEVQCHYDKVYRVLKKYNLNKQGYFQFLDEALSDDILNYYFKKVIGYGHYYSLEKARQMLKQSNLRPETQSELTKILNNISEKKSVQKARDSAVDPKAFDRCIVKLHQLGINPVTIPLAEKVDFLPCMLFFTE